MFYFNFNCICLYVAGFIPESLKVTGQNEILADQDLNHGHRSTYYVCFYCDSLIETLECLYVTRFYKTDPNGTSCKIKLTPPVDSYTIALVVLTLSTTQTTRGWF